MKRMQLRNGLLAAALLGVMVASVQGQHYTNGQVGTFGNLERWTSGSNVNFDNLADELSVRFTAMESITVDRVFQNFGFVDGSATAQVRVGIMADNGSGDPSGTYLTSATFTPVDGGQHATFGSVTLSPNTVYHLVYQIVSLDTDNFITISSSTFNNDIRPYDRALDTNMNTLARNNGGAWTVRNLDPFFFFSNGADTAHVAGPGQPYVNANNLNGTISLGNGGNKFGQAFTITDKEIPAGLWVAFNKFKLTTLANAGALAANQTLIVHIRDTNNTILATATIPASQATGTEQEYTLNQQIELQQGVRYVMTTEFASFGTTAESFHLFNNSTVIAPLTGSEAATGWGGTNMSYVVRNSATGGNVWTLSDLNPEVNGATERYEILFGFQGIVVPEPTTTALALAAAALLARRRFRRE